MPSGDGSIVCARLRADPRGRVIPALMLTADPRASEPTLARIAGADDCLLKPFGPAAQPRSTPGCPSWAETTPYRPDLSEHAPSVEQHPYLAAAADLGPHRDLGNGQAEPLGEQEDLGMAVLAAPVGWTVVNGPGGGGPGEPPCPWLPPPVLGGGPARPVSLATGRQQDGLHRS